MVSSSIEGAVPIMPGWVKPGKRTPVIEKSSPSIRNEVKSIHKQDCRASIQVLKMSRNGTLLSVRIYISSGESGITYSTWYMRRVSIYSLKVPNSFSCMRKVIG